MIAETNSRRVDVVDLSGRFGSAMSSEHAIERVPLSEIREGDMLQDPRSGRWIKVTQTADSKVPGLLTSSSDGETPVIEEYAASTTATEVRRSIPGSLRVSSIGKYESSRGRADLTSAASIFRFPTAPPLRCFTAARTSWLPVWANPRNGANLRLLFVALYVGPPRQPRSYRGSLAPHRTTSSVPSLCLTYASPNRIYLSVAPS